MPHGKHYGFNITFFFFSSSTVNVPSIGLHLGARIWLQKMIVCWEEGWGGYKKQSPMPMISESVSDHRETPSKRFGYGKQSDWLSHRFNCCYESTTLPPNNRQACPLGTHWFNQGCSNVISMKLRWTNSWFDVCAQWVCSQPWRRRK